MHSKGSLHSWSLIKILLLLLVNEEVLMPNSKMKTTLYSSKLYSPSKTLEPNCSSKNNNETPTNIRAAIDSANKREPTSESLHISVKELNKLNFRVLKKNDYSKA